MAKVVTFSVGAQSAEQDLKDAFEHFSQELATHCALVFAEDFQPNKDLVEPVSELLNESLIVHLALVHPSPSLGFVVTSIALRAKRAKVSSFENLEEIEQILKSRRRITMT